MPKHNFSHSELRHRILAALNQKPADSIADLTRSLNAVRPSVSRAIKSLEEASLITRDNRRIILTEEGRSMLNKLNSSLAQKTRKTADLTTRILIDAQKQAEKLEKNLRTSTGHIAWEGVNSLTFATPALESFAQMAPGLSAINSLATVTPALESFAQMTSSISAAVNSLSVVTPALKSFTQMASGISAAVSAITQIQSVNLEWLQVPQDIISLNTSHLFLENNALISGMMIDLQAIGEQIIAPITPLTHLLDITLESTRAYESYFKELVPQISITQDPVFLKNALLTPAIGTSALLKSSRSIIEAQAEREQAEPNHPQTTQVLIITEKYAELNNTLNGHLTPLGERFQNKWEGAWQVLFSDSKDRHSQATHSARELLMQLLDHLAPDESFTEEDLKINSISKVTRKMRIKRILGEEGSKGSIRLIDSFATMLDGMYDVLAGESHRRDGEHKTDQGISALLAALGSFLVLLFEERDRNSSK
jgi:DNA-binding MarR family transcriptional regulator